MCGRTLALAFVVTDGFTTGASNAQDVPSAGAHAPDDPPITALSASLPVREVRGLRHGHETIDVRYPIVDLGDTAASVDLDARVRAEVLRAASDQFGFSRGRCRATLATREIVSVLCELMTAAEEGSPSRPTAEAFTWRLDGGRARRVRLESLVVDGAQIGRGLCAAALRREPTVDDGCYGFDVSVALARDGFVARWTPRRGRARSITLAYDNVSPLIRTDGPLAFAAARASVAPPSRALTASRPAPDYVRPRDCLSFGAPRTPADLGEAYLRANVLHVYVILGHAQRGLLQFGVFGRDPPMPAELAALVAEFGEATAVPCPVDRVGLHRDTTTASVDVADRPGGPTVGTLPANVRVVVFDGTIDGHDSVKIVDAMAILRYAVAPGAAGWSVSTGFRGY